MPILNGTASFGMMICKFFTLLSSACAIAQALILLDMFYNKTIKYLEVSKIIPNFAA